MKKGIMILMLVTTGFFCFAQSGTDSSYTGTTDSVKATIYTSTSPHHNVLHEYTYLVVMRDYCNKTLLRMRDNGDVNKKLSKKLKKELSKAKAELASGKFNGLKIESDHYDIFLKKISDKFKE